MRRLIVFVAVLLGTCALIATACGGSTAPTTTTSTTTTTESSEPTVLTGTVTYKDGSPAANVLVGAAEIYEYRIHDTTTDSQGRYFFSDASPGEWQVSVVRRNPYFEVVRRVTVRKHQENVRDIVLPFLPGEWPLHGQ